MDRNELPTLLVLAASPPGPMTGGRHLPLLLCPLPFAEPGTDAMDGPTQLLETIACPLEGLGTNLFANQRISGSFVAEAPALPSPSIEWSRSVSFCLTLGRPATAADGAGAG